MSNKEAVRKAVGAVGLAFGGVAAACGAALLALSWLTPGTVGSGVATKEDCLKSLALVRLPTQGATSAVRADGARKEVPSATAKALYLAAAKGGGIDVRPADPKRTQGESMDGKATLAETAWAEASVAVLSCPGWRQTQFCDGPACAGVGWSMTIEPGTNSTAGR